MSYKKIFYWSQEDQAYLVFVPTLPGCMSDGETVSEALKNADVVTKEWIEFAKELKNDVPEEDPDSLSSSYPTVFDLASYILNKEGIMTSIKLQKLIYYCQAWCLGWYQQPLTSANFEDWANGPVCRELFKSHKGRYILTPSDYKLSHTFTKSETHLINMILSVYSDKDATWLIEATHREMPWQITRGDVPLGEKDDRVISNEAICKYYGNL